LRPEERTTSIVMGKLAFLTLTFVTVATIGIIYQVHQSQQEKKAVSQLENL
jgi:hypothetical protein